MNETAWSNAGEVFGELVSLLNADNLVLTVAPGGIKLYWPVAIEDKKYSQSVVITELLLAEKSLDTKTLASTIAGGWVESIDVAVTSQETKTRAAYQAHIDKRGTPR